MKSILFLFYRECAFLPPFLTILDALCDDYYLNVISFETTLSRKRLDEQYSGKNIQFIPEIRKKPSDSGYNRCKRRLLHLLHVKSAYHIEAAKLIQTMEYDLLWVIHEETVYEFREELKGKEYITSLYELNDHRMGFLEKIKQTIGGSKYIMVPEYNRACILRTWLALKSTPAVIPNKPLNHPRMRNIANPYSERLAGEKIILYQGYIQRSRNIDALCEACMDMSDYSVVIMGGGDDSYIDELKRKYPQLIHIPHVAPPNHLYITSYAHIAVVKYDFVCLNAIFCAPNKTWEYTGFGIPVLCHAIPGLENTIGKFHAGLCIDMDDIESIKSAIAEIDDNYDEYCRNAISFFESFDIKMELLAIAEKFITPSNVH